MPIVFLELLLGIAQFAKKLSEAIRRGTCHLEFRLFKEGRQAMLSVVLLVNAMVPETLKFFQ